MDLRLGFYVFGISRARRMGIDRVLIHTKIFDILPPPNVHYGREVSDIYGDIWVFSGGLGRLGSVYKYLHSFINFIVFQLKIALAEMLL